MYCKQCKRYCNDESRPDCPSCGTEYNLLAEVWDLEIRVRQLTAEIESIQEYLRNKE